MGPRRLLSGTLVASLVATLVAFSPTASRADCAGSWSKFQYDLSNTAAPCGSTITADDVATLAPRWFVPTQSPVSATPTVVDGVAYAGDWSGTFQALDANTGVPLWAFDVKNNLIHDDQHAVSYAEIVSSASVVDLPAVGRTVFFGGGGTLYALDAATGLPRWAVDTDPTQPTSQVEIESSPVVWTPKAGTPVVYVGTDVNEAPHVARTGVLAFNALTGTLMWKFDPERKLVVHSVTEGSGTGYGCGGAWSTPALDPTRKLLFFGTSNCTDWQEAEAAGETSSEGIWAVNAGSGALVWEFHPRGPNDLDEDFGSSPILFSIGSRDVVAEGGKDGAFYVRDRATGAEVWTAQITQGGSIGGFIGSAALGLAGSTPAIFAASAIPTSAGGPPASLYAIDAGTGGVLWSEPIQAPSYGAVTFVNGVVLTGPTFSFNVSGYDAATGDPLWTVPLASAVSSGMAVVGDSLYFGAGTTTDGVPPQLTGVWDFALSNSPPPNPGGDGPTAVYWDQNEEEDFFVAPNGEVKSLVPPWDPNGQMCIFPGSSGRFTTGYNPTLPDQHNPGSEKPLMNPPVGEAVWDKHGRFTRKTIYIPGPYANPGSSIGGDIPPDESNGNAFNDNGTYTGCAFDSKADLFATDIGTAQGQIPVPDSGRLIEWFPPDYTTYCILTGPTAGGAGDHHVDGTGGLRDPGTLAVDGSDNVYVPEPGANDPATGTLPGFGRVLKFESSSLPKSAADCPGPSNMPTAQVTSSVFIQGSPGYQPFPSGIARDPSCNCWAVSSVFGFPAVAWYDDGGHPFVGKGPVVGGQFTPFGLAFSPAGNLFLVDIHVTCTGDPTEGGGGVGCGPADYAGQILEVTFSNGIPSTPLAIAQGLNYPVSVTTCDPSKRICPRR